MALITDSDMPAADFNIEELYKNIEPAAPADNSIAKWIVPILDKHKSKYPSHLHSTPYTQQIQNASSPSHATAILAPALPNVYQMT